MPRRSSNRAYWHKHVSDPHRPQVSGREQRARYKEARIWCSRFTDLTSDEAHKFAAWYVDAYGYVVPLWTTIRQSYVAYQDYEDIRARLGYEQGVLL